MKKKFGFYTLGTIALVLGTLLILGCVNPQDGTLVIENQENRSYQVDGLNGMGYIRLNLRDAVGRSTVRPDVPDINEIDAFNVILTLAGTSTTITENGYTSNDPILVPPGTYDVEVVAMIGTEAVAYGITEGVNVQGGTGGSTTVILREIVTGTGTGTFEWDITLPTGGDALSTAFMRIMPLRAQGQSQVDVDLRTGGNADDERTLVAGFYRVEIDLARSGYKSVTVVFILHVYGGLISSYDKALPVLKANEYTVTYYYNDAVDSTTVAATAGNIIHGSTLTAPTGIVNRDNSNLFLNGWFRNALLDGTAWVFGTGGDVVIGNTSLYAEWKAVDELKVVIELDYTDPKPPQLVGFVTSYDRNTATISVTITIDNAGDYANPTFEWLYEDGSAISGETGSSITLDFKHIDFMIVGSHTITVIVTERDASDIAFNWESADAVITVTDGP